MPEYENPAKLFLEHHWVDTIDDIVAYADFLRSESGVDAAPPIDLLRIITRFGMHAPLYAQLHQQQGLIVPYHGIPQIIINGTDKPTRQRFTQAHELIELLFLELPGDFRIDRLKSSIFGTKKEKICQIGAANLLMPEESFKFKGYQMGISFQTAELLADEYKVSLIASLLRLADVFSNKAAVVLWKMKNKPSELKKEISSEQFIMPGFDATALPSPKLRVEWCYGKFNNHFIPDDKSIPWDSSVYCAWESGTYTEGEEIIPFPRYNHNVIIENKPISINDEKLILSLIR
jgi:hypothetical protein